MPASRLVESTTAVPDAIVKVLVEAGVTSVFGLSGGNTNAIFDGLSRNEDAIRTVLVRNEAYATAAAEAYARASGSVGVAIGQGSWLMGQGVVGTLEALFGCTPLVLLADLSDGSPFSQHGPYQSATGDYGSWDARMAFKGLTKLVIEAHTPTEAVQGLQLALKHACAGQPGPVALLFHSSSLAGTVGPESVPRLYSTAGYLTSPADTKPDMARVAQALADASFPVILSGGGVRTARAGDRILDVARATGAVVVTTSAGKGTVAEDDPLVAGVFGNYGVPLANAVLGAADTVLVVGSKLGPTDTANASDGLIDPARQQIIQIDIEELNAAWTMPADAVILADADLALRSLAKALVANPVTDDAIQARSQQLATLRSSVEWDSPEATSEQAPTHPQRAIAELRKAFPDDVVICADAGENRLLMCRYFESRRGGEYLQPAGAGGMGYAIPAALGAKAHAPDKTVVAVCGDGGFSMALPALFTAVEEDLPIIVVVFSNGALGWVKHGQLARGSADFKSSLKEFDYAGIGSAIGIRSFHVTEPSALGAALDEAVESKESALVVIDVSTEQTFIDLRTPLLDPKPQNVS